VTKPDLEPLAPELTRLLAVEKARPDPSAAMQARVLERIGSALLDGIPLAGPPVAAVPSPRFRLPLAAGLVALGALGGAGVHALLQKPQPAPIAAPAPPIVAPAPIAAPAPPIAAPPAPPEPQIPARRTVSSPVRPTAPARDGELAAERALLEQARTALARGKPADALALLSRHEREFARGRLSEERQALTILSLAADHQMDAARSNAARFRREFPRSMLLRTIDAALETAP
jgi:hypothetical protein